MSIEHIETFPDGRQMKITFKGPFQEQLRDLYLKRTAEVKELGIEGVLKKWKREGAVERGLKVNKRH